MIGKPERDVDAFAERGVFQDRQALIVEHREHAVGVFEITRLEQRIGRIRTGSVDARASRACSSAGVMTSISSRPR